MCEDNSLENVAAGVVRFTNPLNCGFVALSKLIWRKNTN